MGGVRPMTTGHTHRVDAECTGVGPSTHPHMHTHTFANCARRVLGSREVVTRILGSRSPVGVGWGGGRSGAMCVPAVRRRGTQGGLVHHQQPHERLQPPWRCRAARALLLQQFPTAYNTP